MSADEQARRDRNLYLAHRFAKALGITVEQVKSQWGPDLPATLRKAGIDPMTGEPLPTPPPPDRPPEAILGAAELQQQVKARRRAAADAASDRFKHEWRQEQGLPVAASTPPGRVLDAELTRMAVALGGRAETVAGLCGLGDLVLTCSSPQSRNMSVGLALGQGQSLEAALAGKVTVAEGVASAPAVRELAARIGVEAPICEAVAAILAGEVGVEAAITGLLSRPLKSER